MSSAELKSTLRAHRQPRIVRQFGDFPWWLLLLLLLLLLSSTTGVAVVHQLATNNSAPSLSRGVPPCMAIVKGQGHAKVACLASQDTSVFANARSPAHDRQQSHLGHARSSHQGAIGPMRLIRGAIRLQVTTTRWERGGAKHNHHLEAPTTCLRPHLDASHLQSRGVLYCLKVTAHIPRAWCQVSGLSRQGRTPRLPCSATVLLAAQNGDDRAIQASIRVDVLRTSCG